MGNLNKKKLTIINLASGSSGNATFISDGKIKILIDIGISYKELLNKSEKLNINLRNINYIFITHSHSDHIKGLKTYLANNKNTKVCSTRNILYEIADILGEDEKIDLKKDLKSNSKNDSKKSLFDNFYVIEKINKEINIENITLTPYKAYHDTECIYFIINVCNIKFGILTDCGHIDDKIIESLKNVNYLMIESNYDEGLIDNSIYPRFLINRIKSKYGHLSNTNAAELINKINNKNLKLVCLSHISENSNSEENAFKKVKSLLKNKNINLITASRKRETIIY